MIGADEICVDTPHGTTISIFRGPDKEERRQAYLTAAAEAGFTVRGTTVAGDPEQIRRSVYTILNTRGRAA